MDLIEQARSDLERLTHELAQLQKDIAELRTFIDVGERRYGKNSSLLSESLLAQPSDRTASPSPTTARRYIRMPANAAESATQKTTKKSQVVALAMTALRGNYMQAKEFGDLVSSHGIDLGAEPTSYVSVILSRDGRFKSERAKGGWTFIDSPHKEVTPQGAPTPEGSDLWSSQPEPAQAPETAPGQTQ